MKIGDLVKFRGVVRSRTEPHAPRLRPTTHLPRVYDDQAQGVGIIVEIKNWEDPGDPDNNWGTDAYVMHDSGEIINHDLYDLVRVDDENR